MNRQDVATNFRPTRASHPSRASPARSQLVRCCGSQPTSNKKKTWLLSWARSSNVSLQALRTRVRRYSSEFCPMTSHCLTHSILACTAGSAPWSKQTAVPDVTHLPALGQRASATRDLILARWRARCPYPPRQNCYVAGPFRDDVGAATGRLGRDDKAQPITSKGDDFGRLDHFLDHAV